MQFFPQAALQRSFAVFLLVMGAFILFQNRGVSLPDDARAEEPRTAPAH